MKRISIDTNIYNAVRLNEKNVIEFLEQADVILLSDFVLAELYYGFKLGRKYDDNVSRLNQFLKSSRVHIQHTTIETVDIFSSIRVKLKQQGTPIPIHDIWIASHAMEMGSTLMSYDKHFTYIDGLRLWAGSK